MERADPTPVQNMFALAEYHYIHPNCYVIECLEKISVNEREMTIGI